MILSEILGLQPVYIQSWVRVYSCVYHIICFPYKFILRKSHLFHF